MRRIITYFVNYPKAINILVLFFIVYGTAGTLALKSSFYPLIDPKFIEISAANNKALNFLSTLILNKINIGKQ